MLQGQLSGPGCLLWSVELRNDRAEESIRYSRTVRWGFSSVHTCLRCSYNAIQTQCFFINSTWRPEIETFLLFGLEWAAWFKMDSFNLTVRWQWITYTSLNVLHDVYVTFWFSPIGLWFYSYSHTKLSLCLYDIQGTLEAKWDFSLEPVFSQY